MKSFVLLALLLIQLPVFAQGESMGNGSTGGGNIYGDQLNPWFLVNTKEVNYCVEIAPEFSRLPQSRVLELVGSAIAYWKQTFKVYQNGNFQHDFKLDSRLGTQKFNLEAECNEVTDLKFQLGFLTPVQLKAFPNYKQLLGFAHRTHYDPKTLKGRGFIYIAPEEGKLRPNSPKMHQRPWSHGPSHSLKFALIHELGHVFGLQDDHYSFAGLMSAKFLELITSKSAVAQASASKELWVASPFGCSRDFDGEQEGEYASARVETEVEVGFVETPVEKLRQLLGLPDKFDFHYKAQAGKVNIKINEALWGSIELKPFGPTYGELAPAITLYLTKEQKVFQRIPKRVYNTYLDIYHVNTSVVRKNEVLKLSNGNELKVFITYDGSCSAKIGTVIDGEAFIDIFMER